MAAKTERKMEGKIEKKKYGLRLEERDFEVLRALEKWGVLGLGQLDGLIFRTGISAEERVRLLFNEIERKDYWLGAYKRLSRLEKEGLVRLETFATEKKVYFLTKKGHRLLKLSGNAELCRLRNDVSSWGIRHEIRVAAVGIMIQEFLKIPVLTEKDRYALGHFSGQNMARRRHSVSDLCIPNPKGDTIIEVELNQKESHRYGSAWSYYSRNLDSEGVVLYLVKTAGVMDSLIELADKWGYGFVYAATLDSFRKSLGRCDFWGGGPQANKIYRLRDAPVG